MSIEQKIYFIRRNFEMGSYTIAASESVKMIELALRHLYLRGLTKLEEKDRVRVQKAELEIGQGKGIESFTMGQLVGLFRKSKFLDAWAKVSGSELINIRMINLDELTSNRNKLAHEGKEANRSEAEFLFNCLKMILETFGIESLEENSFTSSKVFDDEDPNKYSDEINHSNSAALPNENSTNNKNMLIAVTVASILVTVALILYIFNFNKPIISNKDKFLSNTKIKNQQPKSAQATTSPAAISQLEASAPPVTHIKPKSTASTEPQINQNIVPPTTPEKVKPQHPKTAISINVTDKNPNSSLLVNQLYNLLKKKNNQLILKNLTPSSFQNALNGDISQIKDMRSSSLILGEISTFFAQKSALDHDIISCDLTFTFRAVDPSGNTVNADSYRIAGAGFSESDAAKNAMEKLVKGNADAIFSVH